MRKTSLIIDILAALLLFSVAAINTATADEIDLYPDDRPGWESAVGVYDEEFFTDATLNPGVSVVSDYPGYVDNVTGVWWDKLVCPGYGQTNTTWYFDTPITAFGGDWNPGIPGGPGACIAVAIDGSWVSVGEIPNNYTGQFWGFVSSEPFSAVHLSSGSEGNGAWCETYELDNMVYSCGLEVAVDIKPASWPNPLQLEERGVLPVAICGTEDFDVTHVDPETVRLTLEEVGVGVAPLRWSYEDVATPYEGEPCCGHDYGADGYLDLTLKFKAQEVIETLGLDAFSDRDVVILILEGNLKIEFDGTRIQGQDCVVVLHR